MIFILKFFTTNEFIEISHIDSYCIVKSELHLEIEKAPPLQQNFQINSIGKLQIW
jgi:hypothetical protein